MVKIDMKMPNKCAECRFLSVAFDSDLFEDDETYCKVKCESVEENTLNNTKPNWCPLIEG